MRQVRKGWLFGLAAMAASTIFAPAASAVESPAPVDVNSFSGAFLAARVAEVDNDLDSAIAFYRRALAFEPDNQVLQQSLLITLISSGRFDEALPYAEKLKTVADVERFSRVALAIDSFRKEKYVDAENWLKLATSTDLDRLVTGVMTAWAKAGLGKNEAALEVIDGLRGPDWFPIFASYHRALIADRAGMKDVADQSYRTTLDDVNGATGAPETWLRAAEAYARFQSREGRKQDALATLKRIDDFVGFRPQTAFLRTDIEMGGKLRDEISTPSEGASEVMLNLGTALNRGGGESFVRIYFQMARALKETDAVLLQLAGVAEQQGDPEEAIALYGRIPATSPLRRASEMQLGLNLADLKRYEEAEKHLRSLLEQDRTDMRAFLALGGVLAAQENYKSSAELYDEAVRQIDSGKVTPASLQQKGGNWNIYYQRGIAYERLKQWPKAEPNFRKALELYPDQPQVLNYLGYSWVDMNMNLAEGLEMIKRAVELRPSDGYIVDSLGWAYYRLGRYEEAVTELERAVSLKPDDPVLNDHLGDAYWRAGRRLEATFQWTHARDMKPEPDILTSVLKKLVEGLPPPEQRAMVQTQVASAATSAAPQPKAPAPAPALAAAPATKAPVPAPTVAASAGYKVEAGQSLWSIASERLGGGGRYREILELNPELGNNPNLIYPGQELKLP